FSIITRPETINETESRQLALREDDAEALLFEWLNRLIYFFDVEMLLFKRFDITSFNEHELKATCYGEKYDPTRHRLKTGVKSATYHMLEVDREKNRAQVIFDI
ncbi:archease, partial [Chloroflexota bacterium]